MRAGPGSQSGDPPVGELLPAAESARKQVLYDTISTATGVALALFMWGHMAFVATILTGERGFDWIAEAMELTWIAQITVPVITILFFVHFVTASRKIPAKLQERRLIKNLGDGIQGSQWQFTPEQKAALLKIRPHSETSMWIWQVRSGMIILAMGSVHLFIVGVDVLQRVMGGPGITAAESMSRVGDGLWIFYAVLLIAVEFHAGIGLYRVTVKWGLGSRIPIIGGLSRSTVHTIERIMLWFFLILGFVTLATFADVIAPPLAELLPELPEL